MNHAHDYIVFDLIQLHVTLSAWPGYNLPSSKLARADLATRRLVWAIAYQSHAWHGGDVSSNGYRCTCGILSLPPPAPDRSPDLHVVLQLDVDVFPRIRRGFPYRFTFLCPSNEQENETGGPTISSRDTATKVWSALLWIA